MTRRMLDFYETGLSAVQALEMHWPALCYETPIIEPCAGKGVISNALRDHGHTVTTGDIDAQHKCDHYTDARYAVYPLDGNFLVVTNPPFSHAFSILQNARAQNPTGIAFLLRLTFLEPTKGRGQWLSEHPPNRLIVLPRYSFTGDGKTDSVTCAWMIWDRDATDACTIDVVPR